MTIKKLLKMNRQRRIAYFFEKTKLLKFINFQMKGEFSDKIYTIPLVNNIGLRNLIYNTEPWMKDVIRKFLTSKNGIFLDIGANIGQTLMKLRSISSIPYIGFEPNPESVVYLERLIKVNKLNDCTVCPVGLSNRSGLITLYSSFEGSPYSTVVKGFNTHHNLNKTRVVSVFRGDDIIPDIFPVEEIAIVKIDVEGAELEVIEGMQRLFKDYRPYVIVEIIPVGNLDAQDAESRLARIDRLLALIKTSNYSIFSVNNAENSYEPITQIRIGKGQTENYLLIPTERENDFLSNSQ